MNSGLGAGFHTDRETIRRAQLGDARAWETLVQQNIGWIFRACCRWTGSRTHAEDMTQDVFIKVFRNLQSYRGDRAGFRTWLHRITRNLLIDEYRRNCRKQRTVSFDSADEGTKSILTSLPAGGFSPEARIERREQSAALLRAFRQLGAKVRAAVMLRDLHGFSYEEIGALLKTPVGTVKSRINRGRLELVRIARRSPALWSEPGPSDWTPKRVE